MNLNLPQDELSIATSRKKIIHSHISFLNKTFDEVLFNNHYIMYYVIYVEYLISYFSNKHLKRRITLFKMHET